MKSATGNIINTVFILILSTLLGFIYHNSFAQTENSKATPDSLVSSVERRAWDRFTVSLGGFLAGYNSGITLANTQVGLGLVVDVEDALGLKTSTFATRAGVVYRFGHSKRHSATLGYFGINRSASKILEEELEIGNAVYPIGTKLDSKYNLSIIRAKYDYSFFHDDRFSFGAALGFYILPINFSIKGQNFAEQKAKFIAPFPVIGLRTDFRFTKKLYLKQTADLLYLVIDEYQGSILDLVFLLEHKTFKNFAFGAGVNSNSVDVKVKNEALNINFFGEVRMDYTGIYLYASYFF